jgi:hypothetical protein
VLTFDAFNEAMEEREKAAKEAEHNGRLDIADDLASTRLRLF